MNIYSSVISAGVGVAIVAPSGYAIDSDTLARGIAQLEAQGCQIHNYYDPAKSYQRFGGTSEGCIAQIHAATQNPEVQIVMALRGGYGLSRLLQSLNLTMMAQSGKLFVGHSDFTVLQMALLAQTGRGSFAGPMLCSDFGAEVLSDFTMQHFWRCLSSDICTIEISAEGNPAVNVSGTLWGGNLAILNHLIGTPYLPQPKDGILFIEDINEHPYRVERMLLQLLHAGILSKQKAILLGDFSSYRLSEYDRGYDFQQMLTFIRSQLTVPVLIGLPFGHIHDKVTLAVGCRAELMANGQTSQLVMRNYPSLRH